MKANLFFILLVGLLSSFFLGSLPGYAVVNQTSSLVQIQSVRPEANKFDTQRQQMVKQQLQRKGIQDQAVLEAMSQVPRHRFVEPSVAAFAYGDYPLSIGQGQTISQPYIVAYMTEAAEIDPGDKVLEIGTGSGYQTAVLGELAREVYTIEIIPALAQKARQTLQALGYTNLHFTTGNGEQGWPEAAPYDAILVTAAPDHIPQPLIDQLALTGKMVIPVGTSQQQLLILTKTVTGLIEQRTLPVQFVPLRGESPEPS
jgi:protein-L-isoaspartate(D-aspartate) O-methyltransferase